VCGDCNKDRTHGKWQIIKKITQPLTTLANSNSYYCGGDGSALSARASRPSDLNRQGREGAGPVGRGVGRWRRRRRPRPRPRHLGLLLFSRGGTASVRSHRKRPGAGLVGAGGRIPPLSCFPKAAAGAGSDTLRLVGLRCPSVRRGRQNPGERISAPPNQCLR